MKQGKLTENVLKRSVLRRIGTYREEMQKGAALGQDCAFFSWKEETLATTTQTAALPVKDAGRLAVYAADNNLAAAGAQTIGISLALTIPETLEEKELHKRRTPPLWQPLSSLTNALRIPRLRKGSSAYRSFAAFHSPFRAELPYPLAQQIYS
jgi:hypothetical protein